MKLRKKRDDDTLDLMIVILGHSIGGRLWLTESKDGTWGYHTTSKAPKQRIIEAVEEALAEHGLKRCSPWKQVAKTAEW